MSASCAVYMDPLPERRDLLNKTLTVCRDELREEVILRGELRGRRRVGEREREREREKEREREGERGRGEGRGREKKKKNLIFKSKSCKKVVLGK